MVKHTDLLNDDYETMSKADIVAIIEPSFWIGQPSTKMGNDRMVEVVKKYGSQQIIVDRSADWGVSDPLSVPKTASLMLRSGISKEDVRLTCYQNALNAFGKCGKMKEEHWLDQKGIDQWSLLFNDNSVLREQIPRVNSDKIH